MSAIPAPRRPGLVVALGDPAALAGYALAGVQVRAAVEAADVRRTWSRLGADVAVVLLTPQAAEALGPRAAALSGPMAVVLPP